MERNRTMASLRIQLIGKARELSLSFVEPGSFSSHILGDFVSFSSSNVFAVIGQEY